MQQLNSAIDIKQLLSMKLMKPLEVMPDTDTIKQNAYNSAVLEHETINQTTETDDAVADNINNLELAYYLIKMILKDMKLHNLKQMLKQLMVHLNTKSSVNIKHIIKYITSINIC